MTLLSFAVYGIPAPQGSKRHVGRGILVESSVKVKPWRDDVKAAAETAMGDTWAPIAGPATLTVTFYLPRPKSAPKTRRTHATRLPDVDKLLRSTMDALTAAGVWEDDARVTDVTARKRYVHPPGLAEPGEPTRPGALVSISGEPG